VLMDYFLQKYSIENNKKILGFEPAVYEKLCNHDWPGNVRELENVIERSVVLANGELLLCEHFDVGHSKKEPIPATLTGGVTNICYKENMPLSEVEKEYILSSLGFYKGNKTKAADALKISVRTLRNKLDEYKRDELIVV